MIRGAEPPELRTLALRVVELERDGATSRDQVRSLLALQDALARIAVTRACDDVIAHMLRAAHDPLGFSRGLFFTVDREHGIETRWQFDGCDTIEPIRQAAELKCDATILATLRAGDAESVGRAHDLTAPLVDTRNWYVASALAHGDGGRGILYLDGHRTGEPQDWHVRLVRVLVCLASVSIENSILFERTAHLAARDPLTGLYNRRAFSEKATERIERFRVLGLGLTYVLVDVDDFKSVNDERGHMEGDSVLRRVARTLTSCTRGDDIVGRYAGDEFVMLLSSADVEAGRSLVARVSSTLRAHGLRCSLGAAQFPDRASNADGLLAAADRALYATKAAGKNSFSFA